MPVFQKSAVALALFTLSFPAFAEEARLKTFTLDSITSIAPSAKSTAAQDDTLKECLLNPGACKEAKFKSTTDFSLDDVVNLKIVDRSRVKPAPQNQTTEVKAEPAPLPSIDMEILFEYDSDQIQASQQDQLTLLARTLADPAFANYTVAVIGHTDAKGSEAYNRDLSLRRAQEVASAVSRIGGIPMTRLSAFGMGFDRLKSEADRFGAQNRRVQILLIPQA